MGRYSFARHVGGSDYETLPLLTCYYGPASHYATFGGDRAADGSTGSYLPEVCPPVSPCTFRSATLPDDAACDALCAAAGCACKPSPWLLYKQTARGAADSYYCSSEPMTVYGLVTPTGESYRTLAPV